jgi:acetylornithine/succinyldiaminopimelate/putrescine aminotransferase
MPIGALWARADVASAFKPGDHGSTYSGQPMATAAARKVLEIMQRDSLAERAAERGAYLRERLEKLDGVGHVRGAGLIVAAELTGKGGPDVAAACLDAGLVVNGITPSAIRLTPPLTVSEAEIDEAIELLRAVLEEA